MASSQSEELRSVDENILEAASVAPKQQEGAAKRKGVSTQADQAPSKAKVDAKKFVEELERNKASIAAAKKALESRRYKVLRGRKDRFQRLAPVLNPAFLAQILAEDEDEDDDIERIVPVEYETTPDFLRHPDPTKDMRRHQLEGLNAMLKILSEAFNIILADDMGLGKTLQTISFLRVLHVALGLEGPFLVVTQKSILGHWEKEFKEWAPTFRVVVLHGNRAARAKIFEEELIPGKFDILLTTYEMVQMEEAEICRYSFRCVVADEGHRLKNDRNVSYQVLAQFHSVYRVLVTGTPYQNELKELWNLLNFIFPNVFGDAKSFEAFFAIGGSTQAEAAPLPGQPPAIYAQLLHLLHLRELLKLCTVRRLKTKVLPDFPQKTVDLVDCVLTQEQAALLAAFPKKLDAHGMRKFLLSPTLLGSGLPSLPSNWGKPENLDALQRWVDEVLLPHSGKLIACDKLLAKYKREGSRVLVFSQYVEAIDNVLEPLMVARGYSYRVLTGDTVDRQDLIDEFNADPTIFAFLLSTRAGGIGINLASADTVIIFDEDPNPQNDLQAEARAHRLGQTKVVQVSRLIVKGSYEDLQSHQARVKRLIGELVMSPDVMDIEALKLAPPEERKEQSEERLSLIERAKPSPELRAADMAAFTRREVEVEDLSLVDKCRRLEELEREIEVLAQAHADLAPEPQPEPEPEDLGKRKAKPIRPTHNEDELAGQKPRPGVSVYTKEIMDLDTQWRSAKLRENMTADQVRRLEDKAPRFPNWSKEEYERLLAGRTLHGHDCLLLAKHVGTKSVEEVRDYLRAIWLFPHCFPEIFNIKSLPRHEQLRPAYERLLANVPPGADPSLALRLPPSSTVDPLWSPELDSFLAEWGATLPSIQSNVAFRYSLFAVDLTEAEVEKRRDHLLEHLNSLPRTK